MNNIAPNVFHNSRRFFFGEFEIDMGQKFWNWSWAKIILQPWKRQKANLNRYVFWHVSWVQFKLSVSFISRRTQNTADSDSRMQHGNTARLFPQVKSEPSSNNPSLDSSLAVFPQRKSSVIVRNLASISRDVLSQSESNSSSQHFPRDQENDFQQNWLQHLQNLR